MEKDVRMRIKVGSSRSGETAADIVDIPNIRTAVSYTHLELKSDMYERYYEEYRRIYQL